MAKSSGAVGRFRLDDALAFLETYPFSRVGAESVTAEAACGRWLRSDVVAPGSLPRFDCAAMDGFALRSADALEGRAVSLHVSQVIMAGRLGQPVAAGEAARIFTGAAMPPGADWVVMQEDAELRGTEVTLCRKPGVRRHIRPVGEDVRRDELILSAGHRLGPGELALLAALDVATVQVAKAPKVALISTGDELAAPERELGPGQIRDTNRPLLARLLAGCGADVTDLGICADEPEHLLRRLTEAAPGHDLIVSTGGASVGLADHMSGLVARRGAVEFWRLQMRPGKPVGFGDIDDCPVLVLPGNPVAALVDFILIGRVILARLLDLPLPLSPAWRLPLGRAHAKPAGRTDVLLGRIETGPEGRSCAMPLVQQGSANVAALARAEILIVLTPDMTEIAEGGIVEVVPIRDGVPRRVGRPPV